VRPWLKTAWLSQKTAIVPLADHSVTTLLSGAFAVSVRNECIKQAHCGADLGREEMAVAA
jgi:hypothetical protein